MRNVIFFVMCAVLLFACNSNKSGETTGSDSTMKQDSVTKSSTSSVRGYEFADNKYADIGKKQLQYFQDGDWDNWSKQFADSIVYLWSNGDSLVGKKAIIDYWKNRRATVVTSVKNSNDIWLPIKVNQPQKGPDIPGVWLLGWHMVDATYKNGNKLTFWVHVDSHFNNNDQIDRTINYVDRGAINAAASAKKK